MKKEGYLIIGIVVIIAALITATIVFCDRITTKDVDCVKAIMKEKCNADKMNLGETNVWGGYFKCLTQTGVPDEEWRELTAEELTSCKR